MNRLASPASDTLPFPSLDPNEDYLAGDCPAYSVGTDSIGWGDVPWEASLVEASPHKPSVAAPIANFTPVHFEARYAYPLMVWLHGEAGLETHLHQIMPLVSMRNYAAVAPRGPIDGKVGWENIECHCEQKGFGWSQSPDELPLAEDRIFQAIDFAKEKYKIHADRVFIAGYGSGGTMAIQMAWKHPHLFAGAASLAGPLPKNDRPLQHLNHLRTLPLLLSSGREAKSYSETAVCHDLKLLHTAGMQVAFRQYPCGDELRTSMLADLDRWMMDVISGTDVAVQA